MSKRDDLIGLHKEAVEAAQNHVGESVMQSSTSICDTREIDRLYNAWRAAENAFMQVANNANAKQPMQHLLQQLILRRLQTYSQFLTAINEATALLNKVSNE